MSQGKTCKHVWDLSRQKTGTGTSNGHNIVLSSGPAGLTVVGGVFSSSRRKERVGGVEGESPQECFGFWRILA